ncbi:MAG: 2Fe-2S iron-sulfur cluster-binding protein [Bifidobacterium mongoliense]|nr:2Fe-2S iron-sulfur cluster-binding protein [Bifidobacterium mongoliense]
MADAATDERMRDMIRVVLRVHRFTPRAERERARSSSPFARTAPSPFGAPTRRRAPRGKRWTQDYALTVPPTTTLLDCLLSVKRRSDPTLAFRYACGHGMCGSDAATVNGAPTLLCTTTVGQAAGQATGQTIGQTSRSAATAPGSASAADHGGTDHGGTDDEGFRRTGSADHPHQQREPRPGTSPSPQGLAQDAGNQSPAIVEIGPLAGFAVQRDLIVDIDPMIEQITRLKPYLQADGRLATTHDGKVDMIEYLQRPEQLAKYELLSDCIACGLCEASCPVFSGGDAFIGPAALIAASRFINDSRDHAGDARLDAIDTADGIAACQSVKACSRPCPRGINVGEEMWQLTTRVGDRSERRRDNDE